jgi:branched-subunit amino acid ABC-type transport system permease component
MIIEQVEGLVATYTAIRVINIALSAAILIGMLVRFPLWLSNPPTQTRLFGLLAALVPLTVVVNATDQHLRHVEPGPAGFGSFIVLIILGALLIVVPENDGRPSRTLRGLERLGVRFRASRQSRR